MVSVIIPVYNVETYIRECVDSVLSQTYTDLEIILVDDGSTDSSGSICDEYSKLDSRIVVIHKENGGLSDARNAGLDAVHGDYILFVDSDDWIQPETVSHLVKRMDEEQAEIVFFDAATVYEDFEDRDYREELVHKRTYPSEKGALILKTQLENDDYLVCACLHFLRADFIRFHNLRFLKGIMHEDNLFTTLAFLHAQRTAQLQEALYYRRLRAGSIMSHKETVRSIAGIAACVSVLAGESKHYRAGSSEYDALMAAIDYHLKSIGFKYADFSKEERQKSRPFIRQTVQAVKNLNYPGSSKSKLKLSYPDLYYLYRRLFAPVKEYFISSSGKR